jgi:hypothetical protein
MNSNTANAAALLWHALHAAPHPSNRVNWAGFYVSDPFQQDQLILGPFQGKVRLDELDQIVVNELTHSQRLLVRQSSSAEVCVEQPQPHSRRSSFPT